MTGNKGESATATASIANVLPEVLQVEIQPSEIREATVAQAIVDAQDVDGDAIGLSYTWQVNGTTVQDGADGTLTGALFNKGDTLQVTVTPNDGFADGEGMTSESVLVLNTAPTSGQPFATGMTLTETDTLTCMPRLWDDVDGDPQGFLYS